MKCMFLSNAKHLEASFDGETIKCITRKFPDGETYFRMEDTEKIKNEDVVVFQGLYPFQNESLVELFLACHTLKDYGAKNIVCVLPYFAYARQDRRFMEGEALSSLAIIDMLACMNVRKIITVDAHFMRGVREFERSGVKVVNVSAVHLLLNEAKKIAGDSIVITPDFGGSKWLDSEGIEYERGFTKTKFCMNCGKEAQFCDCESEKKNYVVKVTYSGGSLEGKNVVILDDMIASGGTMINAAKLVREELGAKNVACCATHGLFVGDALENLKRYADDIIVSNSINQRDRNVRIVDIMKLVKEVL